MSLVTATPAEIAAVQRKLESLRTELMTHAHAGVNQAGFVKTDEAAMAAMMALMGAMQRYALQSRQHYQIFKSLCADMAASEADAVVNRAMSDMGPECTDGGIILPPRH
jgi:hypothetical protein